MTITARRTRVLGLLAAGALVLTAAAPATAGGRGHTHDQSFELTVMGTTDLHGNAVNWDYFKNAEYDDSAHNDVGLAKISTLVNQVRADKGDANTLLIDAGDTIQGTPLDYYYAKIDPITNGTEHPMAAAMNAIGYDAAALGNHEFNYGLDVLRTFEGQLDFPLLGANAVSDRTGRPAFQPYVIERVRTSNGVPIKVGILGLTNPGIAIWDKANVDGVLSFPGLVEQAKVWVPKMRRAGADVVIVAAHSGADTSSSYGDALPFPENAATLVAEQVPGIDAILVGHAHQEIPERIVVNQQTGKEVVLSEPLKWGERLSVFDIDLTLHRGHWTVDDVSSQVLNANTVPEDPAIVSLLADDHQAVVDYVNSVIGTSTEELSAATARYEDAAALDFINYVQASSVKANLTGSDADLPVLSIAAPFNRAASIPAGDVSVRDIAGLYIYDNTLLGIRFTGAEVKAYLEKSAQYFQAVPGPGTYAADDVTNAVTATAPSGTPDYNYDVMFGLDAPLTYDIDLSQPVGSRITDLAYGGTPVADGDEFVVAINNYRQSGGGGFPGVTTAPIVDNRLVEIRQLLIDWVTAQGTIDPTLFSSTNPDWQLTYAGSPLTITP
ncbi:5'-nucleotidase C-terminal domain-containing protein [Actinotalea sp. M2MS4P-6]|uniref:bifunctional metallophosphatase/5'-nucleotidase n=1 Tax=Actinotalea sp. M2MS4P-6 TaxID=2983762 RepID=UPI0021E4407B|nr:5'-nucleotidase C-terminal domain-containing protein [Actinotalea sp. M2MS4P-6]MCV2393094.1 5'-nucleotidase C-terminal domain-containing protein [Actinotalea sp. M2MS4P-6]